MSIRTVNRYSNTRVVSQNGFRAIGDLTTSSRTSVRSDARQTQDTGIRLYRRLGYVPAWWFKCENFGDAMTPYLIEKISGLPARHTDHKDADAPTVNMVTGSILDSTVRRATVWGNGAAFAEKLDPSTMAKPEDGLRILAIRGPLSKRLVEGAGHSPLAVGDPGFLMPRFHTPTTTPKYDIGIICSWVDHDQSAEMYGDEMPVISSMGDVEDIVNRMYECRAIVSSCLHGLAAAAAYGIPTIWAEFSDKMIGDGFKFRDVLSTLSTGPYDPLQVRTRIDPSDLLDATRPHNLAIDLDALLRCCPFA